MRTLLKASNKSPLTSTRFLGSHRILIEAFKIVLLAGCLGFVAVDAAEAQTYSPYGDPLQRPTVSPYLNLLRGTSEGALPNYYTLVRPQLQQRAAALQQQASINQLQRQVNSLPRRDRLSGVSGEIRTTGHTTLFQNYSHYYQRR